VQGRRRQRSCAPVQGRRLEEDCRTKVQCAGKSGWGLGFRCLVHGLTGPKNQVGPNPKPAYMYGYSYQCRSIQF
jgi:hypothetical protein